MFSHNYATVGVVDFCYMLSFNTPTTSNISSGAEDILVW